MISPSLPGGGQRGLFLYSPSELQETQGGEIHLTSGLPSLINQSCYVVQYILRNSVLAIQWLGTIILAR